MKLQMKAMKTSACYLASRRWRSGTDNYEQMIANRGALNYSSKESQAEHPCFVFAPQTDIGWEGDALENINTKVLELIENYDVDPSRIYCSVLPWEEWEPEDWRRHIRRCWQAAIPIANNGFDDLGKGEDPEDHSLI